MSIKDKILYLWKTPTKVLLFTIIGFQTLTFPLVFVFVGLPMIMTKGFDITPIVLVLTKDTSLVLPTWFWLILSAAFYSSILKTIYYSWIIPKKEVKQ